MTAHSQVDNTPSLTESFLAPVTFPGHMIHLLYVTLDIKINKQAAGLQGKDVGRYMYTACHETKTMLDMSQGPATCQTAGRSMAALLIGGDGGPYVIQHRQ